MAQGPDAAKGTQWGRGESLTGVLKLVVVKGGEQESGGAGMNVSWLPKALRMTVDTAACKARRQVHLWSKC